MKLNELVTTSRQVAATSGRHAKIDLLAALLTHAAADEIETAIAALSGSPRQGRIGVGYAALRAARPERPADRPTLDLITVDAALERVAQTRGLGSAAAKDRLLRELFALATEEEQDFLFRLLIGELRQGALEGLMVEAVARATALDPDGVRRAAMLAGDLGPVARATLTDFKAPFIFKGDFTPYFPLKLMHKDLELAMETAYAQNVPMPAAAAVKEVYGTAKAQGKGDLDYAAVITFLEEVAGVKVRAES